MHGLLLRHEHALAMTPRTQALLVDLADTPVLRDDEAAEFDHPFQLFRMPFGDTRRQQPVHGQFHMFGTSRQDADASHVVRVRDDEEARREGCKHDAKRAVRVTGPLDPKNQAKSRRAKAKQGVAG